MLKGLNLFFPFIKMRHIKSYAKKAIISKAGLKTRLEKRLKALLKKERQLKEMRFFKRLKGRD